MRKYSFLPIKKKLIFYYYKLYWFGIFILKKKKKEVPSKPYSIGITTFCERYEVLFKPLLKRISYAFPATEIIVAANGHFDQEKQIKYLNEINSFCKHLSGVKLVTFNKPKGLSMLWNQIIKNASNPKIFIFNDDILFYDTIHKAIDECGILNENISLLNNSFSHFMIDKSVIAEIGWFDERFTEIGGEDDDYHVRLVLKGMELKRKEIKGLQSYKPKLKVNSYGQKTKEQLNGYSNANSKFLLQKWDIRNESFEGSRFIVKSQGNYWKLKAGMGTPNFYKIKKENSE